jgi:hypothetical protein
MSAAELEAPRRLRKPGDTDAVTYAWADAGAELYGLVRVAEGIEGDGSPGRSALAVALAGRTTVAASAEAGGVTTLVEEPLTRWSVRSEGEPAFALEFAAITPPAELAGRQPVAKAGGMEGYEQLCRVRGSVRVDGRERPVRGLGQRGHAWGNPDWEKIALTRSVGAWLDDGKGLVIAAVRSSGAQSHAEEAMWGAALDDARVRRLEDPRLSTTTDSAGRQIRAGLELWVEGDDEFAFRGVGEVLSGATLDLAGLRLDCAFFRWHIEGRTAIGRYDILRRPTIGAARP